MLENRIKSVVKSYPDFPIKGVIFKDLLPILEHPDLFFEIIEDMSSSELIKNADVLIGIDARGFIFASSIALKVKKPLVLARKPGKLPGELLEGKYALEYGNNSLSIQKDSLVKFKKFAIIDDLLATGGTVNCVTNILKERGKTITGISVVAELTSLEGRENISYPIESLVKFD